MEKNGRTVKKFIIACLITLAALAVIAVTVRHFWMENFHHVVTDVKEYEACLGPEGKYKSNYLGRNAIFPDYLPASADTEAFYYAYYHPFDANYLGYLVYVCNDLDFQCECERLRGLKQSAEPFVYGATGFPYELCAALSDPYYGTIYALADAEHNRLIYVELTFCNCFTDIDYESVIDAKYLPYGFNAKPGNAVREAFEASSQ